jgi:hypothetical protein
MDEEPIEGLCKGGGMVGRKMVAPVAGLAFSVVALHVFLTAPPAPGEAFEALAPDDGFNPASGEPA